MTAVLVHGVPSSPALWDPLRERLARRDVVALSLPGFGCPVPAGFDCTKEAYVGWLIGELGRQGGPVDLVGHDWGALLVLRAAGVRPDLVRTWAMGNGPIDPDYVWHRAAQAWQTPGRGEEVMRQMTPERVAQLLEAEGVPGALARAEAAGLDETMKAAILRLYRSAVTVGKEWIAPLPAGDRGLVYWGDTDPYAGPEFADRLATRTGARLLRLPGVGHWLPHQAPEPLARALEELWERS